MTRIPALLGPEYDGPAQGAGDLRIDASKRALVVALLSRAEAATDTEAATALRWELALIDLLPGAAPGVSPYHGASYEQYADFYHLTPDTVPYARERAQETSNVLLRIQYLEFVLLRSMPTGRPWIELQRELLATYREHANGCRTGAPDDPHAFAGIYIEHALLRIGRLLSRPGLVPPSEQPAWADWIIGLAEDSRSFPVDRADMVAQQRHRWVADFLRQLASLPPEATALGQRTRALALLQDAAAYYEATPLNDHFEHLVAEVDALLRKHWGEPGTHEQMIRRQFNTVVRRAEFHRGTGNGLLTAEFFARARALVAKHRQYFTDDEVALVQRAEQDALDHAAEVGEFKRISISIEIPKALMDYVRESPSATVQAIVEEAVRSVPDRARLHADVLDAYKQAPLLASLGRTIIGPGKVVARTAGQEDNVEMEVESRAMLQTQLLGDGVAHAVVRAGKEIGLTPDDLIAPLGSLQLDEGTLQIIRHGCSHFLAADFVAATHILVPHIEDALRQHLKSKGVDTTDRVELEGEILRTDDASLGSLLYKSLPGGPSVREYLGADLWDHLNSVLNSQTGLNLRNDFAHGLARPPRCTPTVTGIALVLLYILAGVAARSQASA